MSRCFRSRILAVLATLLGLGVAAPATAQNLAVAGSPIGTIQDRNYSRLFSELRANGIHGYFPTFQYVEVPSPKSLGFESDFSMPCSPNDKGFAALRATGMKLIIPGELVYPSPGRIGRNTPANDPLNRIIACAGRENIAAITNYDEAAFHGIPLRDVSKFYNQVKAIDPTLPVLMVHGPIITDKREFRSNRLIDDYLAKVQAYSAYSDITGFDLYPIPAFLSKIATPLSGGANVEANRVVQEYMSWINQAVPGKKKLLVMQGFAYTNLYEKKFREDNFPRELLDAIKPPSRNEMKMMMNQARSAGVDLVIWWGPASLPSKDTAPWPSILEMGRIHGRRF